MVKSETDRGYDTGICVYGDMRWGENEKISRWTRNHQVHHHHFEREPYMGTSKEYVGALWDIMGTLWERCSVTRNFKAICGSIMGALWER